MLERVVESRLDDDAVRRAVGDRLERFLIARLARAEKRELRVEREVGRIAEDEIEPLLRDEARAHRDDRHLVGRPKSHLALQRLAALDLAGERVDGIVAREKRIRRRIPQLLIDSVGDADEPIAQRHEHAVEAESAGLRFAARAHASGSPSSRRRRRRVRP